MLETLLKLDNELFFLINRDLQNSFFDLIMPIITNVKNWIPLFAVLIVALLWKGGRRGREAVLLLILTVTLSDQLSSSVIKPAVRRVRPCIAFADLEMVHTPTGVHRSPSFPSSHAANSAAAATLFALFYPRRRLLCFIIAAAVAYSRVYVGVHYVSDVLAGALLGFLCAVAVFGVFQLATKRKSRKAAETDAPQHDEGAADQ